MKSRPFSYLFSISYFGARYKGWAVQQGQPTVEGKLQRVFRYVLGHDDFRMIGSSRTDSGVNCRSGFVQLFLREKIDLEPLLDAFNQNLGGDIRLNSVQEISRDFNLIQSVKRKTYRYFFSESTDFHPFASSFITQVEAINSLSEMEKNASEFIGEYDFFAFCKPAENKKDYVRKISEASVFLSSDFSGDFFPQQVLCLEVTGTGFLHHQVRKMVSAIWFFSPDQIKDRLENPPGDWPPVPTAPANGLILWETILDLSKPGETIGNSKYLTDF